MTVFDYVVLVVVGLSILLSVMRGLLLEVLALAAWALSFWLASRYAAAGANWMPAALPGDTLRCLAAFLAIFCAVWLATAIVRITLNQFLKVSGLKPVDRLLGAGFGFARGVLLTLTLVLVAGMTSLPGSPDWRNAMFSPVYQEAAHRVMPWLPAALSSRIRFD